MNKAYCKNYIIEYKYIDNNYFHMWIIYNGKEYRQTVEILDDYTKIKEHYFFLPMYVLNKIENICKKNKNYVLTYNVFYDII